ncbi:MAG: DsbA family protein [Nitrospinota bacterium]
MTTGRLHALKKTYGDRLEIAYKTFLLAPTPQARSLSKEDILGHWAMAKAHPGGERIDPERMAGRDFPYPYSMPGSVAIKAAAAQGADAEARYVERIEEAHLVDCLDIADDDVLIGLARDLGLDVPRFEDLYRNGNLEEAVWRDHREAAGQGIYSTPTVVLPDGRRAVGAQPSETYEAIVQALLDA